MHSENDHFLFLTSNNKKYRFLVSSKSKYYRKPPPPKKKKYIDINKKHLYTLHIGCNF